MKERLFEDILPMLEAGALVLTVNNRLARSLVSAYDREMHGRGLGAWPTPVVMPVDAWFARTWNDSPGGMSAPVIDRHRAEAIWEDIVANDPGLAPESRAGAGPLASAAYTAYGLVADYGISVPTGIYTTEETRALTRWSADYDRRLSQFGLVDIHAAKKGVIGLAREGSIETPERVVFAGFDEPSPTVAALARALEASGTEARFLPGMNRAGSPPEHSQGCTVTIESCTDEADEVIRAARWVRENIKPGVRIGIIVPELHRYRELIEREFSSELDPASVLVTRTAGAAGGRTGHGVFNISLGRSLADEPLAGSALSLLGTGPGPAESAELISTLTSPYVCPTARDAAALFAIDLELRNSNRTRTTLIEVSRRLPGAGATEGFAEAIGRLADMLKDRSGARRPASSWAAMFTELLSVVGFAKGVSVTSAEYQAKDALVEATETLSTLDDILGPITMKAAHSALLRIARNTVHQSESPDAEVQVLGLLESAGLSFDLVRMLGCHSLALPARPQPNPFIPVYLQREHDLPHSSHERELRFARTLLGRITASTPMVTATYPALIDDRPARPSTLITELANKESGKAEKIAAPSNRLKDAVFAARIGEPAPAGKTLPVEPRELRRIRGGTGIIREQSACPFRAFAAYRLLAVAAPDTTPGLHPMRRGTIAHNAMKHLWEELGTSVALASAISDNTIEGIIGRAVDSAFEGIRVDAPLSDRYLGIERQRLASIITEWLAIESERAPFKVSRLEDGVTITMSGLSIRGRIDRVDECGDGSKVLIDYKTGRSFISDWLPPRPLDPQLPMYATVDRYDAIAFATLRTGECAFKGVSRTEGVLPGTDPVENSKAYGEVIAASTGGDPWDALLEIWRAAIERLASDFVAGRADVDPNPALKGQKSPCRGCEYKPLCRVLDTLGPGYGRDDE